MNSKILVIILSYNRPQKLIRALKSILNQTYTEINILVLDNCSDFEITEIIASLNNSRVSYIRNNENIGNLKNYEKAYEIGIKNSEYFMIFFDDDTMPYDFIAQQMKLMEQDYNCSFVGSQAKLVYDDSKMSSFDKKNKIDFAEFKSPENLIEAFSQNEKYGCFGFGSILFRTSFASKVRPETKRYLNIFDRPLMLDLCNLAPCKYLIYPSINALQHAGQDSSVRPWGYQQEINLAICYRNYSLNNEKFIKKYISKILIQNYLIRTPRISYGSWIADLNNNNLYYKKYFNIYVPYYYLRSKAAYIIKNWLPEFYKIYRKII
jgi:glycosyltransferase involved in cell wall biosynthesis